MFLTEAVSNIFQKIIVPIVIKRGLMCMENGRIRIADIAEELGLSTATVSNVIHGKTKKTNLFLHR